MLRQKAPESSTGYAFGKNSIDSLLNHAPERLFKIMIAEEASGDKRMQKLIDLAREHGKPLQFVPKAKLDRLAEGTDTTHQGIVGMVAPKPLLDLFDLVEKIKACPQDTPALVVALDEVTDPHNFGALIRVAAGSGATAVMVPKTGSAGFSPAVGKASAGTIELIDVAVVPNLAEAIERLKEAGVWWIGAVGSDEESVIPYDQYDFTSATGIVLGSEGSGIRRLVKARCDQLVTIPMAEHVESLNVSVAGGVLLFEALRQRRLKTKA